MAKHRTHSIEFKRQVAQDFIAGETLHSLAKRHDISRNLIRIWVKKLEAGAFDEDARAVFQASDVCLRSSRGHRAINLFVALTPSRLGAGGLIYFYLIEAWNGWMALAAGVVCAAGLYWLWDEHINVGPRPEH